MLVRASKPLTTVERLGSLRVVAALLLCLIGWAHPPAPAAGRGGPARSAVLSESSVSVAPARPPGPALDRGTREPRVDLRAVGDEGGLGPFLLPPSPPSFVGVADCTALGEPAVAPLAGRRSLLRPVARSPPARPAIA